ncbi:hypothetical protein ABNR98_000146 [Salmonella enterica]
MALYIDYGWPVLTSLCGKWHSQQGNLYQWYEDKGYWKQNVNYLASVPTQYGCTTFEEQFYRLIRKIEAGELRRKNQGNSYYLSEDNKLTKVRELGATDGTQAI